MGVISEATPIAFCDDLPDKVDVLVIGGGVIGISTAIQLVESGYRVAVCEKGRVAGEQSSRNWGWIRKLGRDDSEMPIMLEALRLWQSMSERVQADIGFQTEGIIYLARTKKDLIKHEQFVATARQHNVPVEQLGREDVERHVKGQPHYWVGGLRCATDARAEPWVAVPAMARAAQKLGVVIRENCAARGLDYEGGRVKGVITEHGLIRADAVLLAGGAWTSLFLHRHSVFFPQLSLRASVARTAPAPDIYAGGALDSALAFRRRMDGGYTLAFTDHHDFFLGPSSFRFIRPFAKSALGSLRHITFKLWSPKGYPDAWHQMAHWADDAVTPFERMRVLNPEATPGTAAKLHARMVERMPALANVPIIETWAGMIDAMPDIVPTMDEVPEMKGLWVASGFSGHGFGIGPAAGRVMSDLIQGKPTGYDLSRFRFSRFIDGSALRLGPSI